MATTKFPADRGLTARMMTTVFLIGLLYAVFVGVLLAVHIHVGVVIGLALVILIAQYYFSDKIALFSMGGKTVTREEAPELHAVIDRLVAMADMPKPLVAVAQSDIPNAFATGRDQRHAVVCVTTGLLRRLDEPEIEAVLAHELSHVAHRDVAVMTIAGFLGVAAGFITRSMFWFGGGIGGGRRDRDEENNMFLIMLVSIAVYAISFLLTRALSRYRELSADRGAAIITGAPATLASALVKVTGAMGQIPTRDLRAAEPFNAFFFTPAAAPGFSISSLFSTHPTLEQRLAQLSELERQMGHPA
jgi:heat shock protein HtpX